MMPDCHIEPIETQALVAISFGERVVGGPAVIQLEDERYRLTMLSPGGVEVFSISGKRGRVSVTGPEEWVRYLKRLPIERDLRLLFATTDCRAAKGRFHVGETGAVYEGCYGEAWLSFEEEARVVKDDRRGYTLKMVVGS